MSYNILKSTKIVFWDVDNTLVFSLKECPKIGSNTIVKINQRKFWVHEKHVELIKDFKARGHSVVVWSQGGAEWAEMVVQALEIGEWVDLVIPKPDWYFDDKGSGDWLGEERRYYVEN